MTPYDIDAEPFSPRMTRRKFLGLAGCACVAGVGAQYAALVAPSRIVVNSMVVPVPGLPHSLEGLRVGVMSDFHVGDFVSPEFVSDAVGIMNSLHPDMVVLPGDFFQDTPAQAEACADALSDLIANLGVFACPGNHDHHLDLRKSAVPLGRAGVDLLVNESRSVAYGAATMRLVGLDSATEGLADHYRALRSVPEDEMAFVLVHEPDYADFLAQTSGHMLPLQISGHSHGGQVRLPFLGAPILPLLAHRYPRGLRRVEGTERQVFTSTGIGVTVPVRVNCPPEVAVLTLHSTPAA